MVKVRVSEGLRWGRDASPKGYQSAALDGRGPILSRQNNECLHMQCSMGEGSKEPRWMSCLAAGTLSPGKVVFSRLYVLLNYTCPWFYCSQPGDCTGFFVGLEIRLSWNRWIGKSLCYTENIVAVTIVAIEACWKWVRELDRRNNTPSLCCQIKGAHAAMNFSILVSPRITHTLTRKHTQIHPVTISPQNNEAKNKHAWVYRTEIKNTSGKR